MSTPYPHSPYPAYPYQQPGAPYPPVPGSVCEVCGALPAAPVTVRGHQGMVVMMRLLRRREALCRTCALAVFRQMQRDTLVRGWWGPLSLLITPATLLLNLGALVRIRKLPAPVTAAWRPPLDPGRPLLRRPSVLIPLAVLAALVVAVTVLIAADGSDEPSRVRFQPRKNTEPLSVGACAHNDREWPHQDLRNVPCDSPDAQYLVTEQHNGYCADGDYYAYLQYSANGVTPLCLHPVRKQPTASPSGAVRD